jgi:hypothetical protein
MELQTTSLVAENQWGGLESVRFSSIEIEKLVGNDPSSEAKGDSDDAESWPVGSLGLLDSSGAGSSRR